MFEIDEWHTRLLPSVLKKIVYFASKNIDNILFPDKFNFKIFKNEMFSHRSVIFLNRIESVLQKGYSQFKVLQKKMSKFPKYLTRFMYKNWP